MCENRNPLMLTKLGTETSVAMKYEESEDPTLLASSVPCLSRSLGDLHELVHLSKDEDDFKRIIQNLEVQRIQTVFGISAQNKSKVVVISDSVVCLDGKCPDHSEERRIGETSNHTCRGKPRVSTTL